MKKQDQQGLHPSQKRYLRRQTVGYFLLLAIISSNTEPPSSPSQVVGEAPKKTKKRTRPQEKLEKSKVLEHIIAGSEAAQPEPLALEHPLIDFRPDEPESSDDAQPVELENKKIVSDVEVSKQNRFLKSLAFMHGVPMKPVFALVGALVFVVLIQLLYPSNRALPLSRLQSSGYQGFSDERQILKSFEDFDSRIVTVHTHTKSLTTSYKDLGITLKPDDTLENMTHYTLKERLIPFSIFVKGNKTYSLSRDLNQSQLDLYVKDVINQASKKPVDAIVTKQGTQLVVSESEEGYEYQGEVLRSQLLRSDLADKGQIVFAPTILPPAISSDTAKGVVAKMQQRIDNPLVISAEANIFRADQAMLASWVEITHKPDQKTVEVAFSKAKIAESLRPFIGQVDYAPVPTVITMLNGVQAGKVDGSVGKSLQFDDLVERIYNASSPSISSLESNVTTLPPPENIDRRYSKDSYGMQTMLNFWAANHPGDYSIDVKTENGRIEASVNPHQIRPSVGVYRLHIASLIYGKISSNSLGLNTVLQNGQTVSYCLERMVRESDDSCTSSLGSVVNWGASDSLLRAQGFESTTLTEGASLTSANDMTDWLLKLSKGQITTAAQASALIQTMSREVNRSGIPAGSPGLFVASKSGANGRVRHDVGIVYHPQGKYAVSILSEGSSFANIADLTSEINKLMSQ